MLVNVKFKNATLEKLLKNMVVIVDSREDKNKPIIQYLEKKKIPYVIRKLDFGDYSCMLKANNDLGLTFDVSLENKVVVECKQSLEEISGNLTQGRERFETEFMKAKTKNCDVHLVIEKGSWKDIQEHNYNTRYNEKSFYNSLLSFQRKYDLKIHFVDTSLSALHIIRILQVELKKFLSE